MHFIEIINEDGTILYRGENITHDVKNYIFNDILTGNEIRIPKNDVFNTISYTYPGYENILSWLHKIKNDVELSQKEKQELFNSHDIVRDFYDKKIIKKLNIKNYKSLNDVPDNILRSAFTSLVNEYFAKSLDSFENLLKTESDTNVIEEIKFSKADLEENVKLFIKNEIINLSKDNIMQMWPTLLNPSPLQEL